MTAKRSSADRFGRFQFSTRLFSDCFMVLIAWFASYYVRFFVMADGEGGAESTLLFAALSLIAVLAALMLNYVNRLYETDMTSRWRKEIGKLFKTSVGLFVIFVLIYYYFFSLRVSRLHLLMFGVSSFFTMVIGRYICNRIFAARIRSGVFKANVLLVGKGKKLEEYYRATLTASESGRLRVVAQYLGDDIEGVQSIEARNLSEAVKTANAEVVVIAFDEENASIRSDMKKQAMELFEQTVYFLPDLPNAYVGTTISDFHYMPTIEINSRNLTFGKRFIKRTFDIFSSLFAIILLSPLYLIIFIGVKLSSKGPAVFKQRRVTRNGAEFNMYKFRSMRTDMPEQGGAHWTEENDPRITGFGRIIRKTSLDEIPQFFNVLKGEMSLIGPRPERPELVEQFIKEIPGYSMRHKVKTGISGWAQVNGLRGNTSLEKRIDYDLYYIRNWTPALDLKIVILTFVKGFVNKNAY